MGEVILVWDRALRREVARKTFLRPRPGSGRGPGARDRFLTEARITARLEHPGIVPVYELATASDGELFYTMRRVHGTTLDAALSRAKGVADRLALLGVYVTVCQTVAYAHSRMVIHRDLKPHNIMIGAFGETVVLDWGLARLTLDPKQDHASHVEWVEALASSRNVETMQGSILGTARYMSPEQAAGRQDEIDARSDVWSLGAILHEVLTGKPPFGDLPPLEAVKRVRVSEVEPIRVPDVPPELVAIAEKALRRDPAERYPSALELAAEVDAWRSGAMVASYRYTTMELLRRFYRRHRLVIGLGTMALGVALASATGAFMGVTRQRDRALRAEAGTARALEQVTVRALLAEAASHDAQRPDEAVALTRAAVRVGDQRSAAARSHLVRRVRFGRHGLVYPSDGRFDPILVVGGSPRSRCGDVDQDPRVASA